jgi:hypothetical protein
MVKTCLICNIIKGPYLLPSDMKIIAPRIIGRLIKEINDEGGMI